MSTRTSILIQGSDDVRWFYHHTNGHPTFMGLLLAKLLNESDYVKNEWNVNDIADMLLKEEVRYGVGNYKANFEEYYELADDCDFVYMINCLNKSLTCYRHYNNEQLIECAVPHRMVMWLLFPSNEPKKITKELKSCDKDKLVEKLIEVINSIDK